jgi:YbgC/YbaW family acyl-CoA thioester hydrolase
MSRTFGTTITVRWGESDPMGIVFYPTYFAWFDHATHQMFASSGRSLLMLLREDGISVPIAECGATFRAPVFADDELVVASTARQVGTRSFTMDHRVEREGELVANGFEKRVVARMRDDGRLEVTSMSEELRDWLIEGEEE